MMFDPGAYDQIEMELELTDGSKRFAEGHRGAVSFPSNNYLQVKTGEEIIIWPLSSIVQITIKPRQEPGDV